ncbi:MAG: DEAD/DEAH box helicase [Muribaculaceae bacterium]
MNIIDEMIQSGNGKAVVFSQWERMARLLAQELDQRGVEHEFLNGGVPSHKRGAMTERFKNDANCRVFLSTDAGSTGLNLQSASLIINLDLPWNPAVLEQRIGRIYRYGQKDNVQVINLVSKGTIEESMIVKLKFKQNMFSGVLDNGEDTIFADDGRFKQIIDVFDGLVEDNSSDTPATVSSEETLEQPKSNTDTIDDDYYDEDDISDGYYDCIDDFIYDDEDEEDDENVVDDEDEVDEENVEDKEDPDPGLLDKTDQGTTDTGGDAKPNQSSETAVTPQELMAQGVSFFSGLAQTLKSPEATKQLIDSIVKTDPQSGSTSLNIPVPSKEAVEQILNMFSKFFQSTK